LERVVLKALAKAPVDRFATAGEFAQALRTPEALQDDGEDESIAVLPFANLSTDPDTEYFSDGMTEEIIDTLARIPGLRVAARTSSFAFRGRAVDVAEVGEKLKVATVLEGSVRRAGNHLRITAQLIKVADGFHLWSERYDREMTDVFAIQEEIAQAISRRLTLKDRGGIPAFRGDFTLPSAAGEGEVTVTPPTRNLDAYHNSSRPSTASVRHWHSTPTMRRLTQDSPTRGRFSGFTAWCPPPRSCPRPARQSSARSSWLPISRRRIVPPAR
jgi:TolB-like protein